MMTNEHDDNLSGLLAQAVRLLVETPRANERPADLDAIVLRELSRADDSTAYVGSNAAIQPKSAATPAPRPGRRRIMSLRNVATVAAALTAIFVLIHWLPPADTSGGFAFAEVQAQVAKTRSVQFVETRKDLDKDGRVEEVIVRRIKILGTYRKRDEVETVQPRKLQEGQLPSSPTEPYVMIHNAKTGKMITLYPRQKGFVVTQGILAITDDGKLKESEVEPDPRVDFYKHFHDLPIEAAKRVADKLVNATTAAGFEVVEKEEEFGGTTTYTRTYWIDPDTKLPLRIEVSIRSTSPTFGDTDFVQNDFVFDQPLDESLFSTDPPPDHRDLTAESRDKSKEE
jgi:hypothetical protein